MNSRHLGVDLLKVVCAQLIVLHHAVVYAPSTLALALERHGSPLNAFLLEPGRWAVHVFLVLGGFLSSQALARAPQGWLDLAWRRYLRLMPLFMLAMGVTVGLTWLLRHHHAPDFLTPTPDPWAWLSHLTLTFDWFGVEAISAGAWYVAIDFQLYLMLAAWVLLARRRSGAIWVGWHSALMAISVLFAAFWLSRWPWLDVWGPYFWASYGLGVLVAWARQGAPQRWWLFVVALGMLLDLVLEFRGRQALALATAVLLWVWPHLRVRTHSSCGLARAADLSYAVFVGHFSLLIVIGAWWPWFELNAHGAAMTYGLMCAGLAWVWGWALQAGLDRSRAWLSRHFGARTLWA